MDLELVKTNQDGVYTGKLVIHFNKVIPDPDPDDKDNTQTFNASYTKGVLSFSIGDKEKAYFTASLDAKGNLVGTFNLPHQGIDFLSGKWIATKKTN
jgi:hypothetical protein